MSQSNNIITFPKNNNSTELIPTKELTEQQILRMRTAHIDEIAAYLLSMIMDQLSISDVNYTSFDENSVKNIALVVESIKALMYKAQNIEHVLHTMADDIFEANNSVVSYRTVFTEGTEGDIILEVETPENIENDNN